MHSGLRLFDCLDKNDVTYLLSSKNIWKSSVESAIVIMISYAEIGAKEAGRGHEMVLLAAPLRLYWLLCR